ncbi:MAG: PA14 domain-containing protein [Limisphaerales bacterium]|jgi:mono/diheme cytochrome c family protein
MPKLTKPILKKDSPHRFALALLAGAWMASTLILADSPIIPGYRHLLDKPEISPAERGELLLGELNCVACHQADPASQDRIWARSAPDLSAVGSRVTPGFLRRYLSDPHSVAPGTTMPNIFHASNAQARDGAVDYLLHFLTSLGGGLQASKTGGSQALIEKGETLFHSIGCVACHGPQSETQSLEDGRDYIPLHELAAKTTVDALSQFLQDPSKVRPSGRMPHLRLDAKESRAIALYLLREQLNNPQAQGAAPSQEPGIAFAYYEIDGINALPDFEQLQPLKEGIAEAITLNLPIERRNNDYAIRFVGNLEVTQAGMHTFISASDDGSKILIDDEVVVDNDGIHGRAARNGRIELSAGSHTIEVQFFNGGGGAELSVAWLPPGARGRRGSAIAPELLSTRSGQPMIPLLSESFTVDPQKALMGERMFAAMRCVACHEHKDLKPMRGAKGLAELSIDRAEGCLGDQIGRGLPDYQLSQTQRSDIKAALRARHAGPLSPQQTVQRTMAAFNCYACHQRDGMGGPSSQLAEAYFGTTFEIDLGEEGKIPPLLDHAGAKFRPEALQSILSSDALHIRHYMATRMPGFPESMVERFVEAIGQVDDQPAHASGPAFDESMAGIGQKFVGVSGMACITCHRVSGQDALAIQGIDLSSVYDRVQPGWFRSFMLNPAAYKPETRMPAFWPEGQSPFADILGGDATQQIDAIWTYLSLKHSMPLPQGIVPKGEIAMELVPADKPIVHRTFMKEVGPRAVLTGFPEKLNVAYDFNVVRLAKIWRGRFFDHSGVQSGRTDTFLEPLGNDVLDLPKGPAFSFLDGPDAPWPVPALTDRNVGGRFKGYQLHQTNQRPIFRYELESVSIEEAPEPVIQPGGTILKRSFSLKASSAARGLYFLAAEGDQIEQIGPNQFKVGEDYDIELKGSFPVEPIIREQGTLKQLLIPIRLDGEAATLEQIIQW